MKKGLIGLCFLLIPVFACTLGGRIATPQAQHVATLTPIPPTLTAVNTATVQAPVPSPTAAPGSFDAFQIFATEIDKAIHDKDVSFFAEHASLSEWNCIVDQRMGVCEGQPDGAHLQGIPVAQDWERYEVYSRANYQNKWQVAFDKDLKFKLAAVANRFGDNPFMPMATQSFQAVLTADSITEPVHILFFEYIDGEWWLRGELVKLKDANEWLDGICATCYDTWLAWLK
jgi:hypothetical protein